MSTRIFFSVVGAALLAWSTDAAAATGYYQVTGVVVELTDTMIVIEKGDGKWHLMRDASTNATADLKVGAKVTVDYKMMATSVDVKEKAGADTAKKK
ncbi:hypothetical protein AYO49_03185 [Verrucomicrobiaceae bacterium SCGC AG-212-N21]|nr:hypothetical protein AYO49_03185 [Verrucomicrobiaceae bacterium SCGC AG-212-N21]